MVKQLRNKGFTLLEMLFVLMILAMLTLISCGYSKNAYETDVEWIMDDIAITQLKAIIESEKQYYEQHDIYLSFNRKGNVNMANTYIIEVNRHCIVVLLGTGRMYAKY